MHDLTGFARGPLFAACFLFMVLGLARHVILRTRDLVRVLRRTPKRDVPWGEVIATSAGWAVPVRHLFRRVPAMAVSSVVLHVGLVAVPVFLAAHARLWERGTGLRIPALPAGVADGLTLAALAAGAVLLAVRVLHRAARDLSRASDYLLLLAVLLPFASGWWAAHPEGAPLPFASMALVHALSGDLLLLLVPVTKLAHVVLFPFDRLSGDIFWRLVPGAGDRVSETLRGARVGAEA
jgi:hypothetical protein